MKIAVCPGSFDPITVGHLDLVERAAAIFDRVILCVMVNGEKHPMFTPEERLEIARGAVAHLPNVEAVACAGLLADFARERGACALVKGARGATDFDWEYQLAQINRQLCPTLDTVLLPARPEHVHISSTMVREMIRYHQPLDTCVPAGGLVILQRIRGRKGLIAMANDVQYLIDMLYEMIDGAKGVLMSPDKCIIVREDALDLLDELKGQLPLELKKAQDLIRARDEFVENAKKEAEKIRRQADLDAKTIVGESEITRAAREKAHELLRRAEERTKNMVNVTNEYTEDALRRTEDAIRMALEEMQDSRTRFRAVSNEQLQAQRAKLEAQNVESDKKPQ